MFYKLAMSKLDEIQEAMDEAREDAINTEHPLRGQRYSVVLHKSGRVEVFSLVGEEYPRAVAEGWAVTICAYYAEGPLQEKINAREAIEVESEFWV